MALGKGFVSIGLTAAIFVMVVLGPLSILTMSENHEVGCPFMQGQMSICAMSVFDHIEHWQSAFTTTLVDSLPYIAVVAAIGFAYLLPRRNEWSPPSPTYTARPTLFQELFAQGLLNSKAY